MKKVDVDDEVFAVLQGMSEPLVDTVNDTLRRLLGLPPSDTRAGEALEDEQDPLPDKSRRGGRRWTLNDLFVTGRIKEGQRLVWYRRDLDRVHYATITSTGAMQLETGQIVTAATTACKILAGGVVHNGWDVWKTECGKKLAELRDRMGSG